MALIKKMVFKMKKKVKKSSIALMLLFVFFCVFLMINFYVVKSTEGRIISPEKAYEIEGADCILVLGCAVMADKTPSPMLKDRLTRGVELIKGGAAMKLLMSGDHGTENYDEVNTMKNFAIEEGVASEDVFMDHAGFSTYESIYRAKEVFGVKKIIIVTQGYHLYRALYIAKRLGIQAYGVSADLRTYKRQINRDIREVLARDKDFFKTIIKASPTYFGEAIPVNGNGDITNDK